MTKDTITETAALKARHSETEANGAVQALGVVPVHPFQCFPFDTTNGFPWAEEVDDFGFDTVDRQGMQACPRGGPIVLSASHCPAGDFRRKSAERGIVV